jgi:hypothetical protein
MVAGDGRGRKLQRHEGWGRTAEKGESVSASSLPTAWLGAGAMS